MQNKKKNIIFIVNPISGTKSKDALPLLIKQIIDEMFPITMPYMPDNQPWKIHCEDFLFDKNCGDFDTIGIFYVTKPDGKRLYVNRYFVEKDGDWKECDVAEYLWRRERRIK